jgi:MFS family permease
MVTTGETRGTAVAAPHPLRDPGFAIYSFGAVISNAGSFMQSVSVPFVLYEITGSNTWVGAGAFAWLVPSLVVSPWAGTLTDRFDRRLVLVWSNVVQLLSAGGLFLLALQNAMTPARIIALVVFGGLGAGFQYAAAQSMAAVLLPNEQLIDGVRLLSVGFTLSRAMGPAVAGYVLDKWGAKATFGINGASFVVFLITLAIIRVRPVVRAPSTETWATQFRSGFTYVMHRRALRLVVVTGLIVSFFGQSMVQLAAGLAREDFGVEGRGFGILSAVYGVGAVVATVLLVVGGERLRRSRMTLIGLGLFSAGIGVTIATKQLSIGLVGFLVAGTAHALCGTSLNTSMQAQVDEEYRGRALSMFMMALLIGMPFGALIGGWLGDQIGLRTTLAGYATVLVGYFLVSMTRLHRLRLLDGQGVIHVR